MYLAVGPEARGLWLVLGWMFVLLIVYLSVAPTTIVVLDMEQGDKFSHMLAYLVLMSWFTNLFETPMERVTLALSFVAMGVALEFAQRLVEYRSFEVADVGAGTVGVVFGWLLAPPRIPNYLVIAERAWHTHS